MKATEAKLLDFLKKSPPFVIPIYQRNYSWTEKDCRQLWDDIVRTGKSEQLSAHFVGSIVYVEKGLYQVTSPSALLVIDGQQRLTTVTLLIEALARAIDDGDPRGICKNVAGLGRWGNGDVEIGLSSAADLPYVMGLVRQSLETQLGAASESA